MSKLFLITGPAGVGKSTVSLEIAKRLNKSVLLEGDDFYHQVIGGYVSPWMDGNHLDVFWNVCTHVMRDYLDAGYDVVFNYIISADKYRELVELFKGYDIVFKVLLVSSETIVERDKLRDEDCQMGERCIVLLNNFKDDNYDEDSIIYTDNLSVGETVDKIMGDL